MSPSLVNLGKLEIDQFKWLGVLVLFGLNPFIPPTNAQIIQVEGIVGDTAIVAPRLDCSITSGVLYRDDNGGNGGNYADTTARKDTLTICPATSWETVKINFTAFDLAEGDTLFAFDGDKAAINAAFAILDPASGADQATKDFARLIGIGSGTGVGVSKAFGGWVSASCDPRRNSTGCLTFIFETNGDNKKGAGWEAWTNCASRDIALAAPSLPQLMAECTASEPAPVAMVPIIAAEITGDCQLTNNNIQVTLTNLATNTQCLQEVAIEKMALPSSPVKLAPGIYRLIHVLQADTTKRDTQYFQIDSPSLVCNDEVNVAIDGFCRAGLAVDGLLEGDTCVGTGVTHHIIIKDKTGKTITQGSNVSLDTLQIDNVCGKSELTATVVRTFKYAASTALCKPDSIVISCEVKLNFVDEIAPKFDRDTNRVDTLVGCDPSLITAKVLTKPIAIDNCGDTLAATFTIIPFKTSYADCEYPREYLIKWEAADSCQNAATPIFDTIRIIRPTVFSNPQSITEDCSKEENGLLPLVSRARVRPGLRTGKMINGVFSASGTMRLSLDTAVCQYIAVILDSTDVYGPCGKRFAELVWGYLDLCSPEKTPILIDTQQIRFIDETAPTLSDSTLIQLSEINDSTSSRGRFDISGVNCQLDFSKITLPANPKATDNCAEEEDIKVVIKNVQQLVHGKWDTIAVNLEAAIADNKLSADTFRVAYEASENCSKKTSQVFTHFILENNDSTTAPELVCEDGLTVSIPDKNGVFIRPSELIVRAEPACNRSIATTLIRRKGTNNWDTTVLVTCTDIGTPFSIELQVTDDKGNKNSCWTTITTEDKIAPLCSSLSDTVGICTTYHGDELGQTTDNNENGLLDDEWNNLVEPFLTKYNETFGDPLTLCQDNIAGCVPLSIIQQYQLVQKTCGVMDIKRRYRAIDYSGNESEWKIQTISITYEPTWTLKFPKDELITCGDAIPDTVALSAILTSDACDVFAYSVTDKVFDVAGDACLKIERSYEVINWCVYQAGKAAYIIPNDPNGNAIITHEGIGAGVGRFIYTQIIKLRVTETPEITINPLATCLYGVRDAPPVGAADTNLDAYPYECDTLKTFSATALNCVKQPITSFEHTLKEDGEIIINKGKGGNFQAVVEPNKSYEVIFWAFDECGNASEARDTFTFKDCKAPSVYLLDGLALTLGAGDSVALWAADLDHGSWDNCTPKNQLDRRIGLGTPKATTLAEVQALNTAISLTCLEVGQQTVSIYIIDAAGNFSTATTNINVQANSNNCNTPDELTGKVVGNITSFGGKRIGQVKVEINDTKATIGSMLTTDNGQFGFTVPLENVDHQIIRAKKNIDPLNGVTTFDLILISKHILGIQQFDTPYQHIAGDVNHSGTITAFDLVQLRRLILNQIMEFPNNESWRFVDAQYQFTTDNPASEAYKEWIMVKESLENRIAANFVAIKIGDVNDSGNANNALVSTNRTTKEAFSINVVNRKVEKGEVLKVALKAKGITKIEGLQFDLNFSSLELLELEEGLVKSINVNTNLTEGGQLLTSWNGKAGKEDRLYTLTFKAKATGWLSDFIQIASRQLVAEAYPKKGGVLAVKIDFETKAEGEVVHQVVLQQNKPNPFTDKTIIEYFLPKEELITLSIFNAQGAIVRQVVSTKQKGQYQFLVDAKTLNGSGIYYYELKGNGVSEIRKMILVE